MYEHTQEYWNTLPACAVWVVLKFLPVAEAMSRKLATYDQIQQALAREDNAQAAIQYHLSRIQQCQMPPRRIWCPLAEVRDQSLVLAKWQT